MLNELINHLNDAMSAIQNLQLAPTEHNCTRIVSALSSIRKAAEIGVKMDKAREEPEKPKLEIVEEPKGEDENGAD